MNFNYELRKFWKPTLKKILEKTVVTHKIFYLIF